MSFPQEGYIDINESQANAIDRFFHTTTEPFDDWEWEGNDLLVILDEEIIERYSYEDVIELIPEFEKLGKEF